MKKNVFFLSLALLIGLSTWTAKAAEYASGDLSTFIATAEAGIDNVITLTGTTYSFTTVPTLTKTLTIEAGPSVSSRPLITCSFATAAVLFTASGTADQTLTLKGLEFAGGTKANGLTQSSAGAYKFTVSVDNCKTSGFSTSSGTKLFSYGATTGSWTVNGDLTVQNSTFVGGRPNQILSVTTSTPCPNNISFKNCFFDSFNTGNTTIIVTPTTNPSSILIDHCTFKACSSGAKAVLNLPTSGVVSLIKNSIFLNIAGTANNTTAANTSNDKNVVFNSGVTNTAKWQKLSKENAATNTILTTDPALDAYGVSTEATYQNAGTDGITIGYNVPGAARTPSAPTALVATAGLTTLSIAFTPGAEGTAPIDGYKYSLNGGSFISAGTTVSPINIIGLPNATAYSVVIRAYNSVGDGTTASVATRTQQAVVYVSTTGDDVTGNGLTAGTPVATFSKALTYVSESTTDVYVTAGTYNETNVATIPSACPSLTIHGADAKSTIIIAAVGKRILTNGALHQGSNNSLTIQDLTFKGADISAGSGGAVNYMQTSGFKNNLTLNRVIFEGNKVTSAATAQQNGGALAFFGNNLTISNCYFKNNSALAAGTSGSGLLASGGAIYVSNTIGVGTPASVFHSGVFVNINNTTFDGNTAVHKAGAVSVGNLYTKDAAAPNSYVKCTNCTFLNNRTTKTITSAADSYVAAGSAFGAATGTLSATMIYDFAFVNCTFTGNMAGSGDGSVSVFESKSTVDIAGTQWATATFVNNIINTRATANCGAALYSNNATGGTKYTASHNIIESVNTDLITDACLNADASANYNTIGENASNVASTITDPSTVSVFANPYLVLTAGSTAINAGVDTYTGDIVPSTDVRGQAVYSTSKDLGAFEYATPGTITTDVTALDYMGYAPDHGPSVYPKPFTVSGSGLFGNITVTPGTNLEMSSTYAGTYSTTPIVLAQTAGVVAATTLYTRYVAGLTAAVYNSSIVASSLSSADKTITTNGIVDISVSARLVDNTNAIIARTKAGVSATFDGAAVVELYTVNGRLIEKTNAVGSYTRSLNNGLYIIRINGKATKFVR